MNATTDRRWARAQRYIADNQIDAAKMTLESLVRQSPERTDARMLLSSVILNSGRMREAAHHALLASDNAMADAESVSAIAHCLLRLGEVVAARDCLQRFDARSLRDCRLLIVLAHVHQKLGDHPAALALLDRAESLGASDADFRYFRGLQLQFSGRVDEARQELEQCLALGPTYGRAVLTLTRMSEQTPQSNKLDYVQRQLKKVAPGSEDHAALEFAQFEIAEDLQRYDQAFGALQRANSIMYARQSHDIARDDALFDDLIARMTPAFVASGAERCEGPNPIFIVGLPRSGTTLLDRILDRHSMVISTGERNDFPRQLRWVADCHGHEIIDETLLALVEHLDYQQLARRYLGQTQWRANGLPYFIDKLPPNYLLVGLIHRAFPHAPILHIQRDAMDVCFSNYKAMFGDTHAYSYDLSALASRYKNYRRLMQHWDTILPGRVLHVSYRKLVSDLTGVTQQVLAHCKLPYEAACLEHRSNKTSVDTLSSAQVRDPIHARSLGEWQRYANFLAPLEQMIEDRNAQ